MPATISDCAFFSNLVYKTHIPPFSVPLGSGSWDPLAVFNLEVTNVVDFNAPVVLRSWVCGKECIVAIRGTDSKNTLDLRDDLSLGMLRDIERSKEIRKAVDAVLVYKDVLNFRRLIFTGHSLGGYLAQGMAVESSLRSDLISQFIAFNAPGIGRLSGLDAVGMNIFTSGDVVRHFGGGHVGSEYVVESTSNPLRAHSMDVVIECVENDIIGGKSVDAALVAHQVWRVLGA